MTRDYHTGGKYPWRHAFRRHAVKDTDRLVKNEATDVKTNDIDVKDVKPNVSDVKLDVDGVKMEPMCVDNVNVLTDSENSDSDKRTIDCYVRENLERVIRKRAWSACGDSSYDSDESLQPAEREFEKFINEVNKKWWVWFFFNN